MLQYVIASPHLKKVMDKYATVQHERTLNTETAEVRASINQDFAEVCYDPGSQNANAHEKNSICY